MLETLLKLVLKTNKKFLAYEKLHLEKLLICLVARNNQTPFICLFEKIVGGKSIHRAAVEPLVFRIKRDRNISIRKSHDNVTQIFNMAPKPRHTI